MSSFYLFAFVALAGLLICRFVLVGEISELCIWVAEVFESLKSWQLRRNNIKLGQVRVEDSVYSDDHLPGIF